MTKRAFAKRPEWILQHSIEHSKTKTTSRFGGLLVVRHGYLVYEKYFARASREVTPNMASCGKMFTSVCLGSAMLDHPAAFPDGVAQKVFTRQYLPEAFPLSDPKKADIELGHLLTMTSGMADNSGNPSIVHGEDVKLEGLPKTVTLPALHRTAFSNQELAFFAFTPCRHLIWRFTKCPVWHCLTPRTMILVFRVRPATDASRDNCKPHSFDQFHDGPINGGAGTRRTLEMVIASVRKT